jgi:hypothetical protein
MNTADTSGQFRTRSISTNNGKKIGTNAGALHKDKSWSFATKNQPTKTRRRDEKKKRDPTPPKKSERKTNSPEVAKKKIAWSQNRPITKKKISHRYRMANDGATEQPNTPSTSATNPKRSSQLNSRTTARPVEPNQRPDPTAKPEHEHHQKPEPEHSEPSPSPPLPSRHR